MHDVDEIAVSLVLYRKADCLDLLASLRGQTVSKIFVLASVVPVTLLDTLRQQLGSLTIDYELYIRGDNLGFANGHNFLCSRIFQEGFSHALIINPDVEILEGGIQDLVENSRRFETIPALHAPQLKLAESDSNDSLGIVWRRGRRHFDLGQGRPFTLLSCSAERAGVSGAVILINRESHRYIVARTGFLFDPLFLAYREDAELGLRIAALGGVCLIHPSPKFLHWRGTRNGKRVGAGKYLGVRNRFLMRSRVRSSAVTQLGGLGRDLVVLVASGFSREERSAILAAWRLRRQAKFRANRY